MSVMATSVAAPVTSYPATTYAAPVATSYPMASSYQSYAAAPTTSYPVASSYQSYAASPMTYAAAPMTASYSNVAGGFGGGFPMGGYMDDTAITQRKTQMQTIVQDREKAETTMLDQTYTSRKGMLDLEAKRSIDMSNTSLDTQLQQDLMRLTQEFNQSKLGLEQQKAQALAQLEQSAASMHAQAQMAHTQQQMQEQMAKTGFVGYSPIAAVPFNDADVDKRKAAALTMINDRYTAQLGYLQSQFDTSSAMRKAETDRAKLLRQGQIDAQLKQATNELNAQVNSQKLAMQQSRGAAFNEIEQAALAAQQTSHQVKLNQELIKTNPALLGSFVPPPVAGLF